MAPSHSAGLLFWQLVRKTREGVVRHGPEILKSMTKQALITGLFVAPVYLIACLIRDDGSVRHYTGMVLFDWLPRHSSLLFGITLLVLLLIFAPAYRQRRANRPARRLSWRVRNLTASPE